MSGDVLLRLGTATRAAMPSKNKVRPLIIQGHERPLTMVKYNREGDLLVTAAKDHRPCLWYADNGERIGTFDGHSGTVWCVDFNCARCPPLPHTELPFFRAQTALRISLWLIPCISFFLSLLSQTTARTF